MREFDVYFVFKGYHYDSGRWCLATMYDGYFTPRSDLNPDCKEVMHIGI